MSITDQIQKIRLEFQSDLESLSSEISFADEIRIKYLGRKGIVADLFNQMESVNQDERPQIGQTLNTLKTEIKVKIDELEPSQDNIPEGNYEVVFWQEKLSNLPAKKFNLPSNTLEVTVSDSERYLVDFKFQSPAEYKK